MKHRPLDVKYRRFWHEMARCQMAKDRYTATEPTSHLILMADEMRRDGNARASEMLRTAAYLSARGQTVTLSAVRRMTLLTKPRKVKR